VTATVANTSWWRRPWLVLVVFAGGYVAMFHHAYFPLDMPRWITPIWPATSLTLAALLLTPRERWPWFLGISAAIAFAYNHFVNGLELLTSLLVAGNNLAQVLATAWLVTRWAGTQVSLHRVREVLVLLAAVGVVTLLTTFVALAVVGPYLETPASIFPRARWISHSLAAVIVTPAIVTWVNAVRRSVRWNRRQVTEAVLLAGVSFVAVQVGVGALRLPPPLFPAPYLAVLPVVVAALRFGPVGATSILMLVAVQVVNAVGRGDGWPEGEDLFARLAVAQLFLGVVAVTGLLLAASVAEGWESARNVRESETRFRAMFEHATEAIGVARRGGLSLMNPAALRLWGTTPPEGGPRRRLEDLAVPAHATAVSAALASAGKGQQAESDLRLRGLRSDGSTFPMELRLAPFEFAGEPAVLFSARDLTEQERREQEARRINRVLRTISGCNEALVRATSESQLLSDICRIVSTSEGYLMAWVGYVEHDEAKSVRPVASAGFEAGYLEQARITWSDTPEGRGPCGRAVRSGRPVACRNTATDPEYAPWREEATRRGFGSSIALPLLMDGQVFGVLSFYSAHAGSFGPEEIDLLQQMADTMAFGLTALRAREERRQAEAEVRSLLAEAERGRAELLRLLEDNRQAQADKQLSDERYRSAVLNSAIGMALISSDGRWLEVNPALCAMIGYTEPELLALKPEQVTHPDDIPAGRQRRADLIAGRCGPYVVEKRYLHRSGRVVWVQVSVSLAQTKGTGPQNYFCQVQDISARKLAEDALASTAERLAVALRASKFGVWRYNVQTTAYEWDNRMFAIWGFPVSGTVPPVEEVVARVVEEDRPALRASLQASSACDHDYHQRIRICWPDGQVRHVEMHGFIHDDALGRPEWAIGVAGDVTAIVQATSESERLRAQLQQARKMEALGNMAAGVAHDFNNLLTGINGFVELASTSLPPSHEAAQLLEQAHKGAISARDLVRRILNFSRSSKENSRALLDLVGLVRDTTPLIVAALPANVSLSLAARCDAAPVLADASQLQQVMMNLCTNGAHAIGSRPGRIQLAVDICDVGSTQHPLLPPGCATGRHVRLAVADTGCGMNEETRRRIFEPFFTTKGAGEGTGLGLSIVHDIVTAHEGGIHLESTLGQGTTFQIFLPLAGREAGGRRAPAPALPARGSGQRVLVVDDESSVAMILRLALQKGGFEPEVFTSPTEAWTRFASDPRRFDLLIVDQNMPGITGREFIARARGEVPALPVIIISGRFEHAEGQDQFGAERVTALKKPFEIVDLIGAVKASLAGTKDGADERR
jgi:PAS domain S-box-containing protein